MEKAYDIKSILNAIEDINTKKYKKKSFPIFEEKKVISNFKNDLLPTTEKIILEAEEYSNRIKNKSSFLTNTPEDILILKDEYDENIPASFDFEEIKITIINQLYSTLSKKIKKNSLKTIFELHLKIKELEKEIKILNNSNKKMNISAEERLRFKENDEHLINNERNEHSINNGNNEHFINEENEEHFINEENNENSLNTEDADLSESVIKTLRLQDSVIKKFKNDEEKLRLKIVDLEQDIYLLNKKK